MNAETMATLLEYFDLKEFFKQNSPVELAIIGGVMCLMAIGARLLISVIQRKLEKFAAGRFHANPEQVAGQVKPPQNSMDFELFERVMRNTKLVIYLVILDWGLRQLKIGPVYAEIERILFVTICIWAAIQFFTAFIPFNIDLYLRRHGSTLKTSQSRSLMPITKGIIWAIGLTCLLDNLGFHVSTIIAGLGIMGVAVGLAGQAILADFFSYIVILLDKPFRIGDFVELGDGRAGDVEYMGPKTTHLRNLDDDLIICANSEMTKGILVNQGSIHEREVIVEIGVSYTTPLKTLKKLPDMLRDIVNSFPQCSFDRACLLEFGASNLQFQLLYLVGEQRGGIRDFMNTRSQVNLAILQKFEEEGISMDYPTEHVLFNDQDAKPSSVTPKPVLNSANSAESSHTDNIRPESSGADIDAQDKAAAN